MFQIEFSDLQNNVTSKQVPHSFEVSIRFASRHVCNGVIISQRHILSAAHCFKQGEERFPDSALNYMSIVSGAISNSTGEGTVHKIKNVTMQSEMEQAVWHSDIAVVTVSHTLFIEYHLLKKSPKIIA